MSSKASQFAFCLDFGGNDCFFVIRDKKASLIITANLPRNWHAKLFGLKHQVVQGCLPILKRSLF